MIPGIHAFLCVQEYISSSRAEIGEGELIATRDFPIKFFDLDPVLNPFILNHFKSLNILRRNIIILA